MSIVLITSSYTPYLLNNHCGNLDFLLLGPSVFHLEVNIFAFLFLIASKSLMDLIQSCVMDYENVRN